MAQSEIEGENFKMRPNANGNHLPSSELVTWTDMQTGRIDIHSETKAKKAGFLMLKNQLMDLPGDLWGMWDWRSTIE